MTRRATVTDTEGGKLKNYKIVKPTHKGPFLVYRPGGDGYAGCFGVSYWYDEEGFSDGEYIGPFDVTHWMKLPEPPELGSLMTGET